MERTILGLIDAGEPVIREALQDIFAHQDVERSGAPADSLYQVVIACQLMAAGRPPSTIQGAGFQTMKRAMPVPLKALPPIMSRLSGRSRAMDKRTFIGMVEAGEPLIQAGHRRHAGVPLSPGPWCAA